MRTKQAVLALSLAALASVATAGLVQEVPVTLDLEGRFANGNMKTARFSDNPFEFIGCGVRTLQLGDGSLLRLGFCQAGIAEDITFTCFTENPALVDKMADGSDFSFITFAWNENDECTSVGFSTQSFYIPGTKNK